MHIRTFYTLTPTLFLLSRPFALDYISAIWTRLVSLFDTTIKSITIVEDNGIPAHETIKNVFTTDYNKYRDEDTILANKKMQDIKVIWTPEKIIFSDGTSLE
jgi:hypothetical protein